jgi:hypothetical protein
MSEKHLQTSLQLHNSTHSRHGTVGSVCNVSLPQNTISPSAFRLPMPPKKNKFASRTCNLPITGAPSGRLTTQRSTYRIHHHSTCIMKSEVKLYLGVRITHRYLSSVKIIIRHSCHDYKFESRLFYNLQFIPEILTAYDQNNSFSQAVGWLGFHCDRRSDYFKLDLTGRDAHM